MTTITATMTTMPPTMSSQAKVEIRVGLAMPPPPYVIGRMLSPSSGVFVPGLVRLPGLFVEVGETTEALLFEAYLAAGSRLLVNVKGTSTIANNSIVAHRSIICEKFLVRGRTGIECKLLDGRGVFRSGAIAQTAETHFSRLFSRFTGIFPVNQVL